ncbi:hypothetical protein ABU186_01915 [Weissella paramesenteroides]
MAIKTVIKDLLKYAPKSQQAAEAISNDDRSDRRDVTPVEQTAVEETPVINVPEEAVETSQDNDPVTETSQQADAITVDTQPKGFDDNAADDFLKGLDI